MRRWPSPQYAWLPLLVVAMTVVALAIGAMALHSVENRQMALTGESLALTAATIADQLDQFLDERMGDVRAVVQAPLSQIQDPAAISTYLKAIQAASRHFYLWLGVTDATGRIVAATDPASVGQERGNSPWFQAVRGGSAVHVGDVEPFEEAGGVEAVSFTAPIRGPRGEFLGAVTTRVGLPALEDILTRTVRSVQTQQGFSGTIEYQFLAAGGYTFVDSDLPHKGNVNLKRLGLRSALLTESGRPGYIEETHLRRHVPVVTGYASTQGPRGLAGPQWGILVRMDQRDVLAPTRMAFQNLAMVGAVVWLPMFAVLLWTTGRLRKEWSQEQEESTRARAAEAALRTSQDRYRILYDDNPSMYFTLDHFGTILSVNRFGAEHLGYAAEELVGQSALTTYYEDDRQALREQLVLLLAQPGQARRWQLRKRRKDGTLMWVKEDARALSDATGNIIVLLVCEDITKRQQAEEALQASQRQYQQLVDHASDIIYRTDVRGRFTFVNPTAARVTHYSPQELLGMRFIKLIRPDHQDAAEQFYESQFVSKTDSTYYEFPAIRKDGTEVWLGQNAQVLQENGQVVGSQAVARDITERKRMEEALRESETHLRAILNAALDAVVGMDEDGKITDWNPRAEVIFGWTRQEILGQTLSDTIIPPNYRDAHERGLRRFLTTGEGPLLNRRVEMTALRRDGSEFPVELTVSPLKMGNSYIFSAFIADITERKQAEKTVQSLLEGTASVTGEQFFPALVQSLASAIGVRYAFVTELLADEPPRLRILAIWMRDRLGEPSEYDLAHTPCEIAIKQGTAYFPDSVQARFPQDKDLVAFGAASYLGIALVDSAGNTMGHLCILDDKPLSDEQHIAPLLKVFAARAAAELERKQAEEALRASEKRFRTIFDQAPLGIAVIDSTTGKFRRINRTYCDIVGYSHKEMLARTFQDITHPDDLQADLDNMKCLMEGRIHIFRMEKRYVRKDGTIVWVNLVCVPLWWDYETERRFHIAMIEDITERKHAEKQQRQLLADLSQAKEHFEKIFHITPAAVGISTVDEGRLINVNDALVRLTGYSREELIGRTTLDLNLWADASERARVIQQILRRGFLQNKEGRLRTKAGEIRDLIVSVEQIQIGSAACLIYIAHDITERKQVEEALQESEQQLRQALEEREQLYRDLHDNIIQTIYAIGMSVEECQHLIADDPAKASGKLDQATAHLNAVIRDVRNYISGTYTETVSGQQLRAELAKLVHTMEEPQLLRFRLQVDRAAAARLSPVETKHILCIAREAMSNSLRHSGGKTGVVSLRQKRGHLCLEVMDDGVGFDVHAASTRGNGLSNIKARAEKLGAHLQVRSRPGEGTRVILEIPHGTMPLSDNS